MTDLTKARLRECSDNPQIDQDLEKAAWFNVQFNPQSLKLQLDNKVEGGNSRGKQKRQYLGQSSTSLAFDLHFDTADEGTPKHPVSVRTRTAMVERFLLPKGGPKSKQEPPKCKFHWGGLILVGVIESLAIDFDLFAGDGTPLRAKMSVTLKEQDPKYEALQTGPGANQAGNPTPPGQTGTGPGNTTPPSPDRVAPALAGESAADFAVRMGLDPSAWRGIAAGLGASASLSLSAGASIQFNSGLSASAGIGIAGGLELGADVSVAAAFGLGGDADLALGVNSGAGGSAALQSGFALAAAGGLGAAIESVAIVKAVAAADHARRAFGAAAPAAATTQPRSAAASASPSRGISALPAATASALQSTAGLPPPAAAPKPTLPEQARTPLALSGLPLPSSRATAPPAPSPPLADPRSSSFGFGVPLRPRVGGAADVRVAALAGRVALNPGAGPATAPVDPTAAPWTRLPPASPRSGAIASRSQRTPRRPGGCTGCK